jgi:Tubulin-tyrosine ligase family
VNGGPPIK